MSNVTIIRDASSDWLEIARLGGDEIFIFSPFITGESVKDVLSEKGDKTLLIFTSLKMSSVLSGSLELKILKDLMEEGASIWHHPSLHAKIIYSSQHGVIGSQNFTRGGKQNLEASVKIIMSKENIEEMSAFIEEAKADAVLLNIKDIRRFEAECQKFKTENPKLVKKLIEPKVFKSAAEKKSAFLEKQQKSREALIDKINKSGANRVGVRLVKKTWQSGSTEGTYHTLVREKKSTNLSVALKSQLCMVLATGKLFYISKNVSQISKFYQRCTCYFSTDKTRKLNHYVRDDDEAWTLSELNSAAIRIHLLDPTETEDTANIHIEVSTFYYSFELRLYFDGLEIIEISKSEEINIHPVTVLEGLLDEGDATQHYAYPNFVARQSLMVSELQNLFQSDKIWLLLSGGFPRSRYTFYKRTYLERLFATAQPNLFANANYKNIMNFVVLGKRADSD